jgi:asparagine synthase (glutamine-hydrolysing)
MCGIAGLWLARGEAGAKICADVRGMARAVRHRGPDAGAEWIDIQCKVALAHRRLSILDLSHAGAQPMEDFTGRFVIVFNGEIYNHLDLRRRLEDEGAAPKWRGHSDTETLLAAVTCWGLKQTLDRVCGMFAFALWDRSKRALTLARDRLGEKPLYYGWTNGALIFGSELKALLAYPEFDNPIDQEAVTAFMRFAYIPEPMTIFRGIRKLTPGSVLTFTSASDRPEPQPYWSLKNVASEGVRAPLEENYLELCNQVEACIRDVVSSQMLSDVPLGCFLSGGVDSSLVAALMQRASRRKIRTFSIGFEDARFNEAEYARRVAEHIGSEHTEFIVTESDALSVVPDLPGIYDEPFADSSQIPTILLSRLTRQHVTVALSGDGGDEIFGGYNRYIFAPGLWRLATAVPPFSRRAAGRAVAALQAVGAREQSLLRPPARYLGLPITTLDKLSKFGGAVTRADDFKGLYQEIVSTFADPAAVLLQPMVEPDRLHIRATDDDRLGREEWMMATDAVTYLPGDILVKVDRAAMSASLETRAPFLDRRVVELAWRLPLGAKIKGRTGKRILRDILCRYLPRRLQDRPKQGFAIPLDRWLRGELREWAEGLLCSEQIATTGVFDPRKVRELWRDHQLVKDNAGPRLWAILAMQSWLLEHHSRKNGRQSRESAPGWPPRLVTRT